MSKSTLLVVVTFFALFFLATASANTSSKHPKEVTVCDLANNPNRYHGQLVRLRAKTLVFDEWTELQAGGCRIGLTAPYDLKDESVRRYQALVDAKPIPPEPCQDCRRFSVTATLVGVVESADPTGKNPGKPGFGHMGIFNVRLSIRSATNIVATPVRKNVAGGPP